MQELRRIVFSQDELRQALHAQRMDGKVVLPIGIIQSASFLEGSDANVMLHIYDEQHDQRHEIVLPNAFVAAALMGFCIQRKVPLPRNARKSIAIAGQNIALEFIYGGPHTLLGRVPVVAKIDRRSGDSPTN